MNRYIYLAFCFQTISLRLHAIGILDNWLLYKFNTIFFLLSVVLYKFFPTVVCVLLVVSVCDLALMRSLSVLQEDIVPYIGNIITELTKRLILVSKVS